MIINQIKITRATIDDMLDLFELVNDYEVRKNSFNQENIKLEDHKKWFTKKINDSKCLILLGKDYDGKFFGSVRFELDKNSSKNNYIISIQISQKFRGKKYGEPLLKLAIEEFYKIFKNSNILAKIKNNNLASIKIFKKNNFIVINENKQEDYILLQHNFN